MKHTESSNASELKIKNKQIVDDGEINNKSKKYRDSKLNTANYDSDSSVEDTSDEENSEGESGVRAKERYEKEDEDMFLSDNEDHVRDYKRPKKSKIQLLDIAEFKRENLTDVDSLVDNDEIEEKEKDVAIEPFNIDDEIKHGVFDRDGNYIEMENNEDDGPQDNEEWMDNIANPEKVNRVEKKRNTKAPNSRHYMVHEALVLLKFFLVDEKETTLESLGRLNKLRKIAVSKKSNSLKYITNGIELLSDLITLLEYKGFNEVYEYDRKKVQDAIEEETFDDSSRIDNHKAKLWSFKWLSKLDGIHGQFTNYEMSYWQKTYFQNNVIVKFHNEPDEDENWIHVSCLNFM